jgi:hypothetical protein
MPAQTFPIIPSNRRTALFLAAVLFLIFLPVLYTVITVSGSGPATWIALSAALLAGALVAYSGTSSRRVRFEVSPEGLRIRRSIFGRFIPRDQFLLAEARPLDLQAEPARRPWLRTFGAGMLGYAEGWFLLRNREKALAFLTDRRRVALLPTRNGYQVMLSVEDPDAFLLAAANLWGGRGSRTG